ncbi:hypothetical protein K7X08_023628 [Anisodus acutangulus]|uniref:High mobility group B protein 15-like n=1 Tax=Anisodus acutangulus TaxID=402998 RepID=A0A9Q1L7K4_9SOLA|nr:hypothetical protein K7X08_023628 [Anisodus acutangulus]
MASSSAENSPVPLRVAPPNYHPYPPPLATYENVVASPQLFMDTLLKLHAAMRTKFMIPVIGGKALDLHRLFVEVTTRGGITKVLGEKRWKEVTLVFSFPSSATNASFILRKYYISLLFHYERVYYFKAKYWAPSPDVLQQVSHAAVPPHGLAGYAPPPPEVEAAMPQPQRIETKFPEATKSPPSTGSPVSGFIDGKFESGYLVTVKIGSEDFKGVLYQVPMNQELQNQNILPVYNTGIAASTTGGVVRRKRRKKCEIKKRDPAHPKPNRSGYNFFFAEQHSRLKPLYPGKDREFSRMIGELWNNLNVPEKMVYQEKALQDKERYRLEMQDYRERLTTRQIIICNPLPTQSPLEHNIDMIDQESELQSENGNVSWSPEYGASSEKCAQSNSKNNKDRYPNLDAKAPPVLEMKANNVIAEEFELLKGVDMVECEDKEMQEKDEADKQEELQHSKEKVFFFLEDKTLLPTEEKI